MLFKSQVYTQASGSIGGLTYSHNRFGMYTRARTTPVNPGSSFQSTVRNIMANLTQYWSNDLTASQRNAWDSYGLNVTTKNRVGDDVNLSGLNHFVRSNVPRIQAGLPQVDDGPSIFTLANSDPTLVLASSEATQLLSITFDENLDWVDEDNAGLLVLAGRPQQPSINFYKAPWRFADSVDGDSVSAPSSPATMTSPFAVVQDQVQFAQFRISRADGRLSSAFFRKCSVGA